MGLLSSRMRFYATEQLGPRRALTPEGFLVCYDVAIARTGTQKYAEGETPVAAKDGMVLIHREPEHVFREETIASFQGKPVVNDHPDQDVTPENWRQLTIGVILNPRKGPDGLLIADLLITDKYGIALVKSGKVEVSCGYDADYEEIGAGEGRQLNIIGNHLALVERGRCGPRCSIGDSSEKVMSNTKTKFMDLMRRAFKAKDAAEFAELEKEVADAEMEGELTNPSPAVHVHIGSDPVPAGVESTLDSATKMVKDAEAAMNAKLDEHIKKTDDSLAEIKNMVKDALAAKATPAADNEDPELKDSPVKSEDMKDEMSEEEQEDPEAMKDSAKFKDSYSRVLSAAEVIAPGIRVKSFDAAAAPKRTVHQMHEVRLAAIQQASQMADSQEFVSTLLNGKPFDPQRISVRDARTMFHAVEAHRRQANNAISRQPSTPASGAKVGVKSIADLNAAFAAKKW